MKLALVRAGPEWGTGQKYRACVRLVSAGVRIMTFGGGVGSCYSWAWYISIHGHVIMLYHYISHIYTLYTV